MMAKGALGHPDNIAIVERALAALATVDASPSPVSVQPSDERIMELGALHKILIPSSSLAEHSARVTAFARALLSTQPAQPISSEAQEPQSYPEDAIKLVQEYGDARADGDWTLSGRLIGQIIKAIREFRASPAPDVRLSVPVSDEQIKPRDGWAVHVEVDGQRILSIESECLSGVLDIDRYADTVRNCAQHLLSFIGNGEPSEFFPPDDAPVASQPVAQPQYDAAPQYSCGPQGVIMTNADRMPPYDAAQPQEAGQAAPLVRDAQDDDLLGIARTICYVAARMRDDSSEHDPSPLSEFSPLLIAAREACVKRGFTADGLAIAAQSKKEGNA